MATEALQIRVTEGGAREVKRALEDVGKAGETAKSAVERLQDKLSSINLKSLITDAFKLTEAYQQLQTRLRSVTTSQAALDRVSGKLINTANQSRSSLEDAFDVYSSVAAGARRLGRSEDDLVKVTTSLAQAAKLSGASAADADEGFKAFAQGLQSGKLQGDALGTVLQRLPRVADAIARQLNVSREELQRLGDQGKLTGDVLLDSLGKAAPQLQAEFEGLSVTVSDALANLKSTARAAVGELGNSTGVTQLVSQAILTLGRDTDTVKKSVEFFATFIGTTLTATALPKLVSGLKSVTQAMSALRVMVLANPWVALATSVAAVIAYLVTFRNEITFDAEGLVTLRDVAVGTFKLIGENVDYAAGQLTQLMPAAAGFREALQTAFGDIDFSNVIKGMAVTMARISDGFFNIAGTWKDIILEIGRTLRDAILFSLEMLFPLLTKKVEEWINKSIDSFNRFIREINATLRLNLGEIAPFKFVDETKPAEGNPLNGLSDRVINIISSRSAADNNPNSTRFRLFEDAAKGFFNVTQQVATSLGKEESDKRRAAEAAQKLEAEFDQLLPDLAALVNNFEKLSTAQQELLRPLRDLKNETFEDPFNKKNQFYNALGNPDTGPQVREGLRTDARALAEQISATEKAANLALTSIGEVAAGRMAKAVDVVGLRTAVQIEQVLAKATPQVAEQAQKILSTLKDDNILNIASRLRVSNDATLQQVATLLENTKAAGNQLSTLVQDVGLKASTQIAQIVGSASQESQQQLVAMLSQIGEVGREKVAQNLEALGTAQAKKIAEVLKGIDQETIQASNLMIQTAKDVLGSGAEEVGVVVATKLIAGFNAAFGSNLGNLAAAGASALSMIANGADNRASGAQSSSVPLPAVADQTQQLAQTRLELERLQQRYEAMRNAGVNAFNQVGNAAQSMGEKTDEIGQKLKSTFESIFGHLENALVSFVTTGKLDFKSLINSILADLARMVIQMLIIRPLMGFFGGLFGFSAGGLVPGFASGGAVRGAGTSTSDSILARLSHGEFVVNARATEQYYPLLKAINDGGALMPAGWRLPQYGTGGIVGGFDTFDRLPTRSAAIRDESTSPQSARMTRMTRMAAEQAQTMSTRNQRAAGTGGAVVMNSTVNVNVTSRGDANSDGQLIAKQVDAQIKSRFIELLQNERRPGGALSNAKVR